MTDPYSTDSPSDTPALPGMPEDVAHVAEETCGCGPSVEDLVIEEKAEIDTRIEKLRMYINTSLHYSSLPGEMKLIITRQFHAMQEYSEALDDRIKHFVS